MNITNIRRTNQNITDADLRKIWQQAKDEKIEYLDLSYNKGSIEHMVIPEGLKHLKYLYLFQSNIKKITIEGDVPHLEIFHLGGNKLESFSLPSGFKRLEHLRLDSNLLQSFNMINTGGMLNMKSLFLQKNMIGNIPHEMWSDERNCWGKVSSFLAAGAASTGWVINNEAKVIWLGNGMVGKTTLSHQLRTNVFKEIPASQRTHGIEIKEWYIDFHELPEAICKKMEDAAAQTQQDQKTEDVTIPEYIHLRMWDFGGQEYYHATHRLFLNNNVMYLLVWDRDTEAISSVIMPDGTELDTYPRDYWRNNIDYYADKEKVVLEIENKAGNNRSVEDADVQFVINHRNDEDSESITDYDHYMGKLKRGILNNISRLDYLSKPFPKVYANIRDKVNAHPDYIMEFGEFRKFCQRHDLTKKGEQLMSDEQHIRTLTEFLHETGNIICYRYKDKVAESLRDKVFLNPKWVTDTIYNILNKEIQKEAYGEFDIEHVARQTTNSSELDPKEWVDLMKEFRLIFEIHKGNSKDEVKKQTFVAPQYLPKECSERDEKALYHWKKFSKPVHAFTLHFPTFLPKSLFLKFIAEYGPDTIEFIYWKNGLLFEMGDDVTVYAECEYGQRTISIFIQGNDEQVKSKLFLWFREQREYSDKIGISLHQNNKEYKVIAELLRDMQSSKEKQRNDFYHRGTECLWEDYRFLLGDFRDFNIKELQEDSVSTRGDDAPSPYYEDGYALFIGIKYENQSDALRPLNGTLPDVNDMEKHFLDKDKAAFNPANVITLRESEATAKGIFEALDKLAEMSAANPNASIMVFYAGHGMTDGKHYFLAPYDFDFKRWYYAKTYDEKQVVMAPDFSIKLAAIKAKKSFIILDCCHSENIPIAEHLEPSGYFLRGFADILDQEQQGTRSLDDRISKGVGRVILTSCTENEKAIDLGTNGLFTKILLECLNGAGNIEKDGWVTLLDVMRYVPKNVRDTALKRRHNQNPVFSRIENLQSEDFIICAYDIHQARGIEGHTPRKDYKDIYDELKSNLLQDKPDFQPRIEQVEVYQKKQLLSLLDDLEFSEVFRLMDNMNLGNKRPRYKRFEKNFSMQGETPDLVEQLKVFINSLNISKS